MKRRIAYIRWNVFRCCSDIWGKCCRRTSRKSWNTAANKQTILAETLPATLTLLGKQCKRAKAVARTCAHQFSNIPDKLHLLAIFLLKKYEVSIAHHVQRRLDLLAADTKKDCMRASSCRMADKSIEPFSRFFRILT